MIEYVCLGGMLLIIALLLRPNKQVSSEKIAINQIRFLLEETNKTIEKQTKKIAALQTEIEVKEQRIRQLKGFLEITEEQVQKANNTIIELIQKHGSNPR